MDFIFLIQIILCPFYQKNIDKIEADKYISAVSENKKENRLTPSQIEKQIYYSDTHRYIYKNVGTLYFSEPNPEKGFRSQLYLFRMLRNKS